MPARWKTIRNALHTAIEDGDEELACNLIDSGTIDLGECTMNTIYGLPDLDEKLQGGNSKEVGRTPLHLAAKHGHLEVVRALLKHKVDIEACDDGTWTPLHLACGHGNYDAALALIDAGADVNAVDEDGWAPIHQACAAFMGGNPKLLALVLERGGDINAETFDGYGTPAMMAERVANEAIRKEMLGMLERSTPSKSDVFCELCWSPYDVDWNSLGFVESDGFKIDKDEGYDIFKHQGKCQRCGIDTSIWRGRRSILLTPEPETAVGIQTVPFRNRRRRSSSSGRFRINYDPLTHQYRKLRPNSIRLLVLNPGEYFEPIECFLEHYELDKCPKYTALSYTWGSPQSDESILLDGVTHPVRQNLHDFLTAYRDRYDTSLLWIDAVCINQSDDLERREQVQLMNRIYGSADLVLVWLGIKSETTFRAMRDMKWIARRLIELDWGSLETKKHDFNILNEVDVDTLINGLGFDDKEIFLHYDWEAIKEVYDRPWWSRIWVHQEVTASTPRGVHLMCGPHTIKFEVAAAVDKAVHALSPRYKFLRQFLSNTLTYMGQYSRLRAKYKDTGVTEFMRMYDLLSSLQDYQATDPRDKLYALIPLSTDGSELLDVDYSASTEDVYCSATVAFIQHFRNLDILAHCAYKPERRDSDLDLPSWVPNWTRRSGTRPIHFYKRGALSTPQSSTRSTRPSKKSSTTAFQIGRLYNASLDSTTDLHMFDTTNRRMTCKGFLFDSVSSVTNDANNDTFDDHIRREWELWFAQQVPTPTKELAQISYPIATSHFLPLGTSSSSLLDAFLSTLHADSELVEFDVARRTSGARTTQSSVDGHSESTTLHKPHPSTFLRKLFLTSRGYVGLGSRDVKPGDLVVILCGGQMPFLLRKVSAYVRIDNVETKKCDTEKLSDTAEGRGCSSTEVNVDEHYIMLGETYVHGIMDGEAIQLHGHAVGSQSGWLSMHDLELEKFEIR